MAVITGDEFDNTYGGTSESDTIFGGLGNDSLTNGGNFAIDYLYGGDGVDTLTANPNFISLAISYGGDGNDIILHNTYMGSAYGDAGDDDLSGSGYLFGGQGNDILHANKSDAYGDNGDDHIIFDSFYGIAGYGGNGNDFIEGDTGRDSINLDAGDDLAYGNDGADSIDGGTGSDTINGGKGNDLIVSGAGADKLRGGSGADTFEFGGVSDMGLGGSKDLIFDFRSGSDKLSLMRFSTPLEFIGNAGFNGVAGEVRFDTVSKMVQVDIDGDGDADGMVKIFSNVFDAGDLIF